MYSGEEMGVGTFYDLNSTIDFITIYATVTQLYKGMLEKVNKKSVTKIMFKNMWKYNP